MYQESKWTWRVLGSTILDFIVPSRRAKRQQADTILAEGFDQMLVKDHAAADWGETEEFSG